MEYSTGQVGRVFVAKLGHEEPVLPKLAELAQQESISHAIAFCIGAMGRAEVVVGPEHSTLPPDKVTRTLTEAHEVVGIATLFWESEEPHWHWHASLGRGDSSLTGCIQPDHQVFLVLEVVIFELIGISAQRVLDPQVGLALLKILDPIQL